MQKTTEMRQKRGRGSDSKCSPFQKYRKWPSAYVKCNPVLKFPNYEASGVALLTDFISGHVDLIGRINKLSAVHWGFCGSSPRNKQPGVPYLLRILFF